MKTPKQDTQVTHSSPIGDTFFARFMGFWIQQKLLMCMILVGTVLYGLMVAPF